MWYYQLINWLQSGVSVAAPPVLSTVTVAAITALFSTLTASSAIFELKQKQDLLNNKIKEMKRLKDKIKCIEVANDNLTEEKINQIFEQFTYE